MDRCSVSDIEQVVFGDCRRCGGLPPGGRPSLSGADASRDTDQDMKLSLFRGEWLCPRCIQNIINREQSQIDSYKIREDQKALKRAGFVNNIT